jgi:hypothetical protein
MRDVLVVMAKKPVAGEVKTRLAHRFGAAAACALYRAFLRDLHARLSPGAWRMLWAVQPAGEDLSDDIGTRVTCLGQRGADLGERMHNVFADLFASSPPDTRIAMIGADVPHLAPASISAAFAALDAADVVLVPTRDGGYCLVGLRRAVDLFTALPMGTDQVLRRTEDRVRVLGLRLRLEPETFDVDEPEDLEALADLLRRGEVALPHTAALLRSLEF